MNLRFIKKCLIFVLLFLCFENKISAQSLSNNSSNCSNLDFSHNNFDNWVISYGGYHNCCIFYGVTPLNIAIINNVYFDANACGNILSIPLGFTQTLKLGNDFAGGRADRASYELLVDENNALITVAYAVLLQEPNHPAVYQPRFDIKVLNTTGSLMDSSCSVYSLVSDSTNPIFSKCFFPPYNVTLWKKWAIKSIDLMPYVGQKVVLEFTSRDCALGGHYGYAYLALKCGPRPKLEFKYCQNDTMLKVSAPNGFENYLWNNGATSQSVYININQPQYISVEMTSLVGCKTVLDTVVSSKIAIADFIFDKVCVNDSIHFSDLSSTNLGYIKKWEWDFDDGNYSVEQNPVHKYIDNINQHYVNFRITTSYDCVDEITKLVENINLPEIDFVYTPQPTTLFNPIIFFNSISHNQNIISYVWDFAGLGQSIQQNPVFVFPDTGSYPVTLIVVDDSGCVNSITYIVDIDDINTLYIPTAFTPNGDGINDLFEIFSLETDEIEIMIYNRWGNLVFYTNDIKNKWSGKNCQDGIYVYKGKVKFQSGEIREFIGQVNLIR